MKVYSTKRYLEKTAQSSEQRYWANFLFKMYVDIGPFEGDYNDAEGRAMYEERLKQAALAKFDELRKAIEEGKEMSDVQAQIQTSELKDEPGNTLYSDF